MDHRPWSLHENQTANRDQYETFKKFIFMTATDGPIAVFARDMYNLTLHMSETLLLFLVRAVT